MENKPDNKKNLWKNLGIEKSSIVKEKSAKIKLKIPHTKLDLIAEKTGKNKKAILEIIVNIFNEDEDFSNSIKISKYTLPKEYQFKSYTIGKKYIHTVDELIKDSLLSRNDFFTIGINLLSWHLDIEERPQISLDEINNTIQILNNIADNKFFIESLYKLTKYSEKIKEYESHFHYALSGLLEEIENIQIEQDINQ